LPIYEARDSFLLVDYQSPIPRSGGVAKSLTMTLKQLEAFYWICRLGTFAAAAERLNTTQSSISMRIRQLEDHLNIELFKRDARTNRLSLHGEELFGLAQNIFKLVSEMQTRIAEPGAIERTIRLGASESIVVSWMSEMLAAVNARYPKLKIELQIDLTLNQLRKLRAGELDLALLPEPWDKAGLVGVPLGSVKFAWMASPKLRIPKGRLVPADLERWPLLMLSQSAHSHAVLGKWFENHGVNPKSRHLANSVSVLLPLTLSGSGVSFLPIGPLTAEHIRKGRLNILDVGEAVPSIKFEALYERGREDPFIAELAATAARHSSFPLPKGSRPARPRSMGRRS
jgi:DNA-binding transcriptional LysR family regulator